MNLDKYNHSKEAYIDAFNQYFGRDFFGLTMQEIREYRSYANGAWGGIKIQKYENRNMYFGGEMQTQADKTIDALGIYDSLLTQIPKKPERMNTLKQYLALSAISERPDFRRLPVKIKLWETRGFKKDPAKAKNSFYNNMKFDNLYKFYTSEIKGKPVVYIITSNIKKIDKQKLSKYGELKELKIKDIIRK